jgi:hypothetical protein
VTTLFVGNTRTEEMVGELSALSPADRLYGGFAALRLLWFAGSGDVLVLPYPPRPHYLAYITAVTGADPGSLVLLCPPPGALGIDLLTPDRIAEPHFREQVRVAVRDQGVDRVFAVYKDVPVTQLATAVRLAVPGHALSAQGGDAFLNSKAAFRAFAAGAGVPIIDGLATARPEEARAVVTQLLAAGHSAILKREFAVGGTGNEVLSPVAGVPVVGTESAVVLADDAAVRNYFARRWDWLSAGGRHQVVIERYLIGCDTLFGECAIEDDGPELLGVGECVMSPVEIAEVIPAQGLGQAPRAALVRACLQLSGVLHAIGYRGYVSIDAVLTPTGEIFITEWNARLSGCTHLNLVVHRRLLKPEHQGRRVTLEQHDWVVPSFEAAVQRLDDAGLAFDRDTGTGVLLTSDVTPDKTVTYCMVAENLTGARALERRLRTLFTEAEVDAAHDTVPPAGAQMSSA